MTLFGFMMFFSFVMLFGLVIFLRVLFMIIVFVIGQVDIQMTISGCTLRFFIDREKHFGLFQLLFGCFQRRHFFNCFRLMLEAGQVKQRRFQLNRQTVAFEHDCQIGIAMSMASHLTDFTFFSLMC